MATYVGFFSNIKDGSFNYSSQWGPYESDPLDDTTEDLSVWYKVIGYNYDNLHNYGIKANTPIGFRFVGWYTLSSNRTTTAWSYISQSMLSSTPISTSESFTPNSSSLRTFLGEWMTGVQYYFLYAKYTNQWSVTLNQNGGSGGTQSVTATYGQPMPQITIPTRAGYTFTGYYDTNDSSGGTQYYTARGDSARNWDKPSDATLYARWIGNELIVTYNPNGGFSDRYFDRVRAGGTFPALPVATWGGENTSRWYTSPTDGTEIHQGDRVTQTEDFSIYAHWNRTEQCIVTLECNIGTLETKTISVAKGSQIGTLPTPSSYDRYSFLGWFTKSGGGGERVLSTTVINDDITIYANFKGIVYRINFDAKGGIATPSYKDIEYGASFGNLPECRRDGKTFLGWFRYDGVKIFPWTKLDENHFYSTFYAHWSDVDPAVKWYYLVSP